MTRLHSLIILLWLAVTALSGALFHRMGHSRSAFFLTADFHPWWAFLSSVFMAGFLAWQSLQYRKNPAGREALLGIYGTFIGLTAVVLTGLGARMGFLPLFFHQALLWPFVLLIGARALKRIFQLNDFTG